MTHDTPRAGPFVSSRERRLWVWAAVAVAGVLVSLTFAQSLSETLRNRNVLDTMFVMAFVASVVAVTMLGLRRRPRIAQIAVALGIAAVYVVTFARIGIPEERTHLIEYGVVAVLVYEALLERQAGGGRLRMPALTAMATTAAVGWLDEGIQWLLPDRVYDLRDVGFNTLAAVMAVAARVVLGRAAGRRSQR